MEKLLSSQPLFVARLSELKAKAGEEYKSGLEDTLRVLMVVAHRIRGKGPNDPALHQLLAINSDMKALAEAARGDDSPTIPTSASPAESPSPSSPPALTAEPGLGLRKFLTTALVAHLGAGCTLPTDLPFCQISLVPPMPNNNESASSFVLDAGLQLAQLERIFQAEQARSASRAALPREVDSEARSCCARQGCDIDDDLVVCKHAKHGGLSWCSVHAKHPPNIAVKRPQE